MAPDPKVSIVGRKDLLRVFLGDSQIASELPLSRILSMRMLDGDSVGLVYGPSEPSSGIPAAIVIRSDQQEFFAWLSTYAPQFSPITQFSRVIDAEQLPMLLDPLEQHGVRQRRHAWAGLVMGESLALQAAEQAVDLEKLSLPAAQSTHSFVIAKADCLWAREDVRRHVENSLRDMQSISTIAGRPLLWSDLNLLWGLLAELFDGVLRRDLSGAFELGSLRRALHDLAANSSLAPETLLALRSDFGPSELLLEMTEKTAEDRVLLFDLLLREFREAKLSDDTYRIAALVVAYAALRIGGGSTLHTDLLKPLKGDHPMVWLWYGLIASLGPLIQWDRRFSRTARLIERELTYQVDLLQPPHSDISWQELKTVGTLSFDTLRQLPRAQLRSLTIEVFPGVAFPVALTGRNERPSEPESKPEISKNALSRLDNVVAELLKIRHSLAGHENSSSGPSLNQSRRSKRKSRSTDDEPLETKKMDLG